jgi:hypothetical protein
VDLFDFFPPIIPGPEPAKGRNLREDVVGGVVVFGLPALALCLLMFTELSKRPDIAVLWMPVIFTLVGALICVLARMSIGRSIVALLGCLWWCLAVGFTLVVIDILIFPF